MNKTKIKDQPVVLVVEDEDALSTALCDELRRSGYQPLCAMDGELGLRLALKEHPAAIILDLMMPKMGGAEMLEQLRQDSWGKDVPVIVTTNAEGLSSMNQCLKIGIHDYFVKSNVSLKTVINAIGDLMPGKV